MTGRMATKHGEIKERDRSREEETNHRRLRLNVQSARRGCGGDEILNKRNLSSSLRAEEGYLQVLPVGQWPPFSTKFTLWRARLPLLEHRRRSQ